jgi:DNA repair photolyase
MEVVEVMAKSILTPQKAGFLASRPHPFTHTLSPYTGCAYGATACGGYCYAQHEPNWLFGRDGADWGQLVKAKVNAAALLDEALRRMGAPRRRVLRIFMSSTTDPYQPGPETTYQLTRQCLGVFARYPDLDLLVIQTRSPLAKEDIGLMGRIPYAWLSVTLETDDWGMLRALGGGAAPSPPVVPRICGAREAARRPPPGLT